MSVPRSTYSRFNIEKFISDTYPDTRAISRIDTTSVILESSVSKEKYSVFVDMSFFRVSTFVKDIFCNRIIPEKILIDFSLSKLLSISPLSIKLVTTYKAEASFSAFCIDTYRDDFLQKSPTGYCSQYFSQICYFSC